MVSGWSRRVERPSAWARRRHAANRVPFVFVAALLLVITMVGSWLYDQSRPITTGRARVIDGDSLVVGGTEIRLYGIDAPEYRQTCQRGSEAWACGLEAAQTLRAMVAGRDVTCKARERDRYGRTVAVCNVGQLDLGSAMVRGGMAIAYGAYEADEREARDARRGIWASTFDQPAVWRARHPRPNR